MATSRIGPCAPGRPVSLRSAPGGLLGNAAPAFLLAAIFLLGGCAGKKPSPPTAPPAARLPLLPDRPLRIGIAVGKDSLAVTAREPVVLETIRGEVSGRFRRMSLSASVPGRIRVHPGGAEPRVFADTLRLRPPAEMLLAADGVSYRGWIEVFADQGGRLTAVNVVELEDYLLGVVPLEIGSPGAEAIEAVKAQAVAARTYAVSHLERWPELGFDLHGDVRDQAYGGESAERPGASRAVTETSGVVAVYNGVLIGAYYSAACGGMTAAVEETWNFPPEPYLEPHPDRQGGADFCSASPHYRWEERWTGNEFMNLLERYAGKEFGGPEPQGPLEDVRVVARNSSGRVRVLEVRAGGREYRLGGERGDRIRWVLRRPGGRGAILRSTQFELEVEKRGNRVETVVARGAGNGHGVGMCQAGALGMAARGHDHADILEHYYPGIRLVHLDDGGQALRGTEVFPLATR